MYIDIHLLCQWCFLAWHLSSCPTGYWRRCLFCDLRIWVCLGRSAWTSLRQVFCGLCTHIFIETFVPHGLLIGLEGVNDSIGVLCLLLFAGERKLCNVSWFFRNLFIIKLAEFHVSIWSHLKYVWTSRISLYYYVIWLNPFMGRGFKTICHFIITQFHLFSYNLNMWTIALPNHCKLAKRVKYLASVNIYT